MENGYKFQHPENKTGKGGIKLFDNSKDFIEDKFFTKCYRRIYPDFYRPNSKVNNFLLNDGIILDAKYKHLENGFVRDDLYQIISYMHTMEIPRGGFIYPLNEKTSVENNVELTSELKIKKYKLAGLSGDIKTIGFPISISSSFLEFTKKINNFERELIKHFH